MLRAWSRNWGTEWRSAFVEVALIIVGVTVALAVDESRKDRRDAQLTSHYMSRLVDDFEEHVQDWNKISDVSERKIAALDRAILWGQRPGSSGYSARQFLDDCTSGSRKA